MLQMQYGDDLLARFAHARVERSVGNRVHTSALKQALTAFAGQVGVDAQDLTTSGAMHKLPSLMKKLYGSRRSSTNNAPYYENVRLLVNDLHPSSTPSTVNVGLDDL